MFSMLRDRKGFTLVELAIVLVIIGILLGAVLKGQEMIKSAKYKRLYNTYRELIAATYTYYDKYQRYPGDDTTATTRWPTATTADGNGNGFIDLGGTLWCASGGTGENCVAFQHLRLGNLLTGSSNGATTSRMAPTHPFGASTALVRTSVIGGGTGGAAWNKAFSVCFQNLTYETAQWLDTNYDDGVATTGSIRGTANYMATGTPDTVVATVCIEG